MSETKTVPYNCGNCFHWQKVDPPLGTLPVIGRQRGICWGGPPQVEIRRDGSGQRNVRPHTLESERACGSFMPADAVAVAPPAANDDAPPGLQRN